MYHSLLRRSVITKNKRLLVVCLLLIGCSRWTFIGPWSSPLDGKTQEQIEQYYYDESLVLVAENVPEIMRKICHMPEEGPKFIAVDGQIYGENSNVWGTYKQNVITYRTDGNMRNSLVHESHHHFAKSMPKWCVDDFLAYYAISLYRDKLELARLKKENARLSHELHVERTYLKFR